MLAPTQGSRRVCQGNIDAALPRKSFKPELEALTTFVGFGCAWGEAWDVDKIVTGLGRNELKRWKAAKLYDTAKCVVVDEGAQTPVEHLDVADQVAQRRRRCTEVFGGLQLVLFMDAVQTPPPTVRNARGAEMLWEAQFFKRAEAAGDVGVYALEKVWRTDEPKLLALAAACRREDADAAWPLVEEATLVRDDGGFTDLVHDNVELYPLAKDKYDTPGAVTLLARSELGGNGSNPVEWSRAELTTLREQSKLLVVLYLSVGQAMEYLPVGEAGAKTVGGWRLVKGELLRVVDILLHGPGGVVIEVECVNLRGRPRAYVSEEDVWVNMGDNHMKIWALPLRYVDILTVYSAQGSQFEKVHVHASRFKAKRNLLYTAVTRAKKAVKISGIATKLELRKKIELHPKTVLWQHERCGQGFPAERLAAARRDAARMQ